MVIERAVHMCLPAAYISRTVQQNQSKGARLYAGAWREEEGQTPDATKPALGGLCRFRIGGPG